MAFFNYNFILIVLCFFRYCIGSCHYLQKHVALYCIICLMYSDMYSIFTGRHCSHTWHTLTCCNTYRMHSLPDTVNGLPTVLLCCAALLHVSHCCKLAACKESENIASGRVGGGIISLPPCPCFIGRLWWHLSAKGALQARGGVFLSVSATWVHGDFT